MKKLKQSQKPNLLFFLKLLTKLILNKSNEIDKLPKDPYTRNYLKSRLFNYVLIHPRLCVYLNIHLNNLYEYDKYDLTEWVETFKLILKSYNITSEQRLYFSTSNKNLKRSHFKNELKIFINEVFDKYISEDELNELYRLYNINVISNDFFEEIKNINNRKSSKSYVLENIETVKNEQPAQTEYAKRYITWIESRKPKRESCKKCELRQGSPAPIISNKEDDSRADILIIGEYPTSNNFVYESNIKHIVNIIKKYNLTFIATNLAACHFNINKKTTYTNAISNCKEIADKTITTFDADFKIFLTKKVEKTLIDINSKHYFTFSSIENKNKLSSLLKEFENTIKEYLKTNFITKKDLKIELLDTETNNNEFENCTLFDVKILKDVLLYILIDNNTNEKKYIKRPFSFPVYVKNGQYQDCEYITNKCDFVTYLTEKERSILYNTLNKKIKQAIMLTE